MLTILLPPSEGKATGGRADRPWQPETGRFGDALAERRHQIVAAVAAVDGGDPRLLGISGENWRRAAAANTALVGAPTRPAWQRFTGVVWDHLDIGTLDASARRRARRSVLVVTALTGLSALDDPLPDFRLKLSVNLAPLGKLSTWWRPAVTEVLDVALRRRLVVDLLPHEHAAAWVPNPSTYDLRRVRFVGLDGRVAGHTAKAAKGRLARALLSGSDPERVLATWTDPEVRIEIDAARSA